jgi:hypothetical protein
MFRLDKREQHPSKECLRYFAKISGYSHHLEYFTIRHIIYRVYSCKRVNSTWVVRDEVEHALNYLPRLLLFNFCTTVCIRARTG